LKSLALAFPPVSQQVPDSDEVVSFQFPVSPLPKPPNSVGIKFGHQSAGRKEKKEKWGDLLAPLTMASGHTNRHFPEIGNFLTLESIQISLNGRIGVL
jgi:hypothetical protein